MRPERAYSDWKGWEQRQFGECAPDTACYYTNEIGKLIPIESAQILEIGFGNGSFLGWARSNGHAWSGIEENTSLVNKARASGMDAYGSVEKVKEARGRSSFDIVTAFDVLEHIPFDQLEELFSSVRYLLKPGGLFVARFPNGDSPYGRAYQHGDPTHVSTLGKGIVDYIALRAGFSVRRFKEPALPLFGCGAGRMIKRALIHILRYQHRAIIGLIYFGGDPPCLTANLVAVLRVAPVQEEPRIASR